MRLFTFHHAGGDVSAFAGWQRALGPAIEVVPVRLPGRGRRGWSRPHRDMTSLAEALADDLAARLTGRHLFYGHSMGAMVAYRLARIQAGNGRRLPERLIVGACAAPHRTQRLSRLLAESDAGLARWLTDLSDSPAAMSAMISETELGDALLARLREDLRLCSTRPAGEDPPEPLDCPIDVFSGLRDPLVPLEDAQAWSSYSTVACRVHPVRGGHFFPRESRGEFFPELRSVILPVRLGTVC